jgi:AraC-like DNA-binding protein/quercetin dioxygenase-like cupin family protein
MDEVIALSISSFDLLNENQSFGIQYMKYDKPTSMPSEHYHDHFEIYYQLTGERYYFIKDRSYYVKKGDIIVINKTELHKTSFAGAEVYERILINFKEDYIRDMLNSSEDMDPMELFSRDVNVYSLSLSEQNFAEQLLNKMLDENKKRADGFNLYMKISLLELLIFLNRLSWKAQNHYLEFPSALHKKISTVAKYISNNYFLELTLNGLSLEFHVSPFYLSRTFKEVTGITLTEYINITRIKEAQRLLVDTNLGVSEIAEKVGFDSSTHFGRVFKSIVQVPPLKFRKINIGNKN